MRRLGCSYPRRGRGGTVRAWMLRVRLRLSNCARPCPCRFDDDVGIFRGVGEPINTAPLDALFNFTASIGIRPVVEISCCPGPPMPTMRSTVFNNQSRPEVDHAGASTTVPLPAPGASPHPKKKPAPLCRFLTRRHGTGGVFRPIRASTFFRNWEHILAQLHWNVCSLKLKRTFRASNLRPRYCPQALAGSCKSTTDAYRGFICAPNLDSSHAAAVPLPDAGDETTVAANYARGNAECAEPPGRLPRAGPSCFVSLVWRTHTDARTRTQPSRSAPPVRAVLFAFCFACRVVSAGTRAWCASRWLIW